MEYGGYPELNPPAPEDEDNIIAALRQSDRVRSISLTITSRLSEKLCAIWLPLSKLEDLALLSQESVPLTQTLTSVFQCGARLRRLHLTWVTFPALLQLLHSSRGLVDLQLHEVLFLRFCLAHILPFSGMTQLQSLSLHFLPTTYVYPPLPSGERVHLPVLARFSFEGNARCLESLVAGIDAPHLGRVELRFFDGANSAFPKLIRFINRIKLHKSHRRADVLSSERAISVSLTQLGTPTYLKIELLYAPLALQLSFMVQICTQLSTLFFDVEDLHINAMRPLRPEEIRRLRRETGRLIAGVKWFLVRELFAIYILCALQLSDTREETVLLPALQRLYILEPGLGYTPCRAAIVSLMTSRLLSDHHIAVEYERLSNESEVRGEGTAYESTTATTC